MGKILGLRLSALAFVALLAGCGSTDSEKQSPADNSNTGGSQTGGNTGGTGSNGNNSGNSGSNGNQNGNGGTTDPVQEHTWGTTVTQSTLYRTAANPSVAIDETGIATAAWLEGSGSSRELRVARSTSAGSWQASSRLSTGAGEIPSTAFFWGGNNSTIPNPQLASANGRSVALWWQHDGKQLSVYASNYRNNQWGNPVALENDDTTAAQFARAVIDSAGNVTAVWVQGDSTQRSLMSAHFSASSLSWGSAQAISSADIPVAEHPEIGLAANGTIHVLWRSYTTATGSALKHSYLSGNSWTTQDVLRASTGRPVLTFRRDTGAPIALWARTVDGKGSLELGNYLNSSWSRENTLSDFDLGVYGIPALTSLPGGNAVIAWTGKSSPTGYTAIYARAFKATGGWQPVKHLDTGLSSGSLHPVLVSDKHGRVVLLWNFAHTQVNYSSDGVTWSATKKPFGGYSYAPGLNSGLEHGIAMSHDGAAVAIWVNEDNSRVETALTK